jgi:aspartyl-tRNA(Asn)/glutamyl-tRNA(Gln) amidotransferase subunit C
MATIANKTVEDIAKLAKLSFSPQETEALAADMNSILNYIDQLQEVDVTGVAPLENINEDVETASLRSDEMQQSISRDEALRNAPKAADGFFLVPKVISGEAEPS